MFSISVGRAKTLQGRRSSRYYLARWWIVNVSFVEYFKVTHSLSKEFWVAILLWAF